MKVVKYLKENGLEALKEEFKIKVKEYPEGLLVLNYDQIESPKSCPIVMECRSLILDTDFNVVSRSFDRFFNYGEMPETQEHIEMHKAYLYEKIDGSLIKIYNFCNVWYIATRGTAFAESEVNGFDIKFVDLVYKALDVDFVDFQNKCNQYLDKSNTYICEVTALENRVVKHYSGYDLYLLAVRKNATGKYLDKNVNGFGFKYPKLYLFSNMEQCIETVKELKNLDEGYVLYQDGSPVCKIKSPTYVAVHHIRGEGLNPKRIGQLVLAGEVDEYLNYFPEDAEHFDGYLRAFRRLLSEMSFVMREYSLIESQKGFALAVKDFAYSGVLFKARKMEKGVQAVFNSMPDNYKLDLLLTYKNSIDKKETNYVQS